MNSTKKPDAYLLGRFPANFYLVIEPASAVLRCKFGFENYDDARRVSAAHAGSIVTNNGWLSRTFGSFASIPLFVLPAKAQPALVIRAEAAWYAFHQ